MAWFTGLVSITFRKLTPAEIIGLVTQTPLGSIEWGGDIHVPHGDVKRAAEVGRMTREAGLAVSAYGSYYGETDGLVFDRVLDSAVALGAPVIRIWAGRKESAAAGPEDLERIIEDNKARYYETLQQSSQGWHEGKHDPWPYVGYLLFIIKKAYDEFEQRAGELGAAKGEKTAAILRAIEQFPGPFAISDIQNACPGVSVDMIRRILKDLKAAGRTECLGMGRSARWKKK